jgi:hypothetical protein
MEGENKRNQKIPGSLSSPGYLFFKKNCRPIFENSSNLVTLRVREYRIHYSYQLLFH